MTIHTQAQMRLSITRSADNSADYVQILGDVDLSDSRALGLAARQLIDANAAIVYVDLAGTTFMGSTLVAFLVHVGNNGRARRPTGAVPSHGDGPPRDPDDRSGRARQGASRPTAAVAGDS